MFVRIKTTGKNQYLQIVHNYREGSKVHYEIFSSFYGRQGDEMTLTEEMGTSTCPVDL